MPNFKIIQDVPDQARIKIFGSENAPLLTTNGGYLSVTAPVDGFSITGPVNGLVVTAPASGLSVTAPVNGLTVTASADGFSVTGPVNGLIVTAPASGLSVTAPVNGLTVTASADGFSVTGPVNGLIVTAPASGLSVTPPTGGLLITSTGLSVISSIATTDVTEAKTGITDIAGSPSNTYQVLGMTEYSFGLVNQSTSAANAQATVKLQISPDGVAWFDNSAVVTLNQSASNALVSSIFLKYARVYYAAVNAASSVDLTIFLQGQT